MFRSGKKKLLLSAALVLMLLAAVLVAAPQVLAHTSNACHSPSDGAFHTIEEGETLCWYFQLARTTKGRLNAFIHGSTYEVMVTEVSFDSSGLVVGDTIVAGDSGAWGPIRSVDRDTVTALQDCPMPRVAISRWEYSPANLDLEPGMYAVWLTVTLKHKDVSSLHMCGEPPAGPPSATEAGTYGPFPFAFFTVVPAD